MGKINLSFAGCGFLGIYHVGVGSAIKQFAPQLISGKISGASAGALTAACLLCDCSLGQVTSDTLEIACKARSRALGPLHPGFNIVAILKNGLRRLGPGFHLAPLALLVYRILAENAHEICSGRLHISLTRWRDNVNVIVNQFESREDLIQALICSSFVPYYSGLIPPLYQGEYYWDGGLSNNNPILDEHTIIVSPFGGESDICPRDPSNDSVSIEIKGTSVHWSLENMYRMSKALFPPHPEVLKEICRRGYQDALRFLKSRDLLRCSLHSDPVVSLSSVFGDEYVDVGPPSDMDDDDPEKKPEDVVEVPRPKAKKRRSTRLKENCSYCDDIQQMAHVANMLPAVVDALDATCNAHRGLLKYIYHSKVSRVVSLLFIPWTLPVELAYTATKRLLLHAPELPSDMRWVLQQLLIALRWLADRMDDERRRCSAKFLLELSTSGSDCACSCSNSFSQRQLNLGFEFSYNDRRYRLPSSRSTPDFEALGAQRVKKARSASFSKTYLGYKNDGSDNSERESAVLIY